MLWQYCLQVGCPSCHPTNIVKALNDDSVPDGDSNETSFWVTRWRNGYGVGTCDLAVVGSIPGQAAIGLPRSTQPFIPPG